MALLSSLLADSAAELAFGTSAATFTLPLRGVVVALRSGGDAAALAARWADVGLGGR